MSLLRQADQAEGVDLSKNDSPAPLVTHTSSRFQPKGDGSPNSTHPALGKKLQICLLHTSTGHVRKPPAFRVCWTFSAARLDAWHLQTTSNRRSLEISNGMGFLQPSNVGLPYSATILLMEEILHHLGWLKP